MMESNSVDEREDVQKKTFAKWINSQLAKHGKPLVEDLFQDLRDGEVLLSLLEILTSQQFKRERGRMRVHHLNNVNAALRALAAAGVRLVNISSGDIVDGNPKLILGLVWSIILHWQVHVHLRELVPQLQHTNLERTLLAWCRAHTENYSGVKVENLTSSWADGLALNALLHRWRPQLFDYSALLNQSPRDRLEHAFSIAHTHLGIDRLLDPEDVNTANPDKKSIMMYLMCLFQSLPHEPDAAADEPASPDAAALPDGAAEGSWCGRSRPVSGMSAISAASGELGAYGAALEEALAALLDGEERLAAGDAAPDPDDGLDPAQQLAILKTRFHAHEKFLLELSEQQGRVGAVLEEGARLIRDVALTKDELNEVRLQMRLLSQRWESLRLGAMATQARVHQDLMRAQHHHLDAFSQWLTETEDRMSRLEAAGGSASEALAAAQRLRADLTKQQPLVDALAAAVLVVEEGGGAGEAEAAAVEDRLRALGERWAHACSWLAARLRRLAPAEALRPLAAAVDTLEQQLKQMEAYPASEIGEVLSRVQQLQQCQSELNARAHELAALAATGGDVEEAAEPLHDRLDALRLMLAVQADRIKDLGFEFDIDTTEESNTVATSMTVTTTSESDHRSKKPRLLETSSADFQAGFKVFEDWAGQTEKELENCANDLRQHWDSERRESARALLRRVTRESEDKQADFGHVEEIQRRLAADAALKEEAKLHANSIEELKKRWDGIQKTILDIRNTMNLLEDKENFYNGLEAFQKELDDIHTWKERMLKEKPTNNQLIHLRNKIRALKQLELRLKELNAQSIILLTKPISKMHKDDIERDSKRINEAFEELLTYLSKREVEIKIALNKTKSLEQKDEYKTVHNKIQDIESQIIAEHAMISSKEEMTNKLEELKKIYHQFGDLQASYDAVVRERREKHEKGSIEELNFRSSVENLVTKFTDSKTILEQKINKLEKGICLLDSLESESGEVKEWLDVVEKFTADHEAVPLGDVPELERLLTDSNKFEEEKSIYKSKLENIEKTKEEILEDCEDALAKHIVSDTKELDKRYSRVTEAALSHNEQLRRALERSEHLWARMEALEQWLRQLESKAPNTTALAGPPQLYQMKTRYQALKDSCDEKSVEFRDLNEDANEILVAGERAVLARKLTQLSALWDQATHCVYERYKVLAEAWHEWGELRAAVAQQTAWLDGLQRRLRPAAPADAEEIADELYELENYLAQHSEERSARIEAVGRQLADAHILPDLIHAELAELAQRWDSLRGQAAERAAQLEAAARQAAEGELALDEMHRDLDRLREEPKSLWASALESQRAAGAAVQLQVEAHRAAGRAPAAARLQERLLLAQQKIEEMEEELQRSPESEESEKTEHEHKEEINESSDSDSISSRLSRAEGTLRALASDAAALALHAAHPDLVRPQLRRCLRFYRTLSEIKSEVESIIKTGRKMVEEKSVADPQEFSKKIDTLKELYNKLGAHVTESKSKLETALLTAREIQNDLQSLTSWLQGLGNVGKQTLELEMSRMEATKDKLNANYVEFSKNCDPVYLENLREQIDDINNRWDHLKRHGLGRKDPEGKKETEVEILQRYLNDITKELESPETMSAAKLKLLKTEVKSKANEVDTLDNKALTKQWEKILEKITAASSILDSETVVEYENVTDTIKRRLESPINTPETEKPEFKKSKIPLAVKSPVPIKKEIKEGGNRSRGSSLERPKKKDSSPMTDSVSSTMSVDSMEGSISIGSVPSTPGTPKKDSSTFNLLKDSDLFTQISKNKVQVKHQERTKSDPCKVVAVKEHEIVKATVSPVEPMEIYPSDAIETVVEFIPQNVETVEILDDTEGESLYDSDDDDASIIVDLGSEPKTFVIEVKKLEERMKPTLGILKKRNDMDKEQKVVKLNDVPDIIPSENDVSMRTPPSTPMDDAESKECPLLYDLAIRQKEAHKNLMRDEVNEYLILDEVPKDQAALPEPSATETLSNDTVEVICDDKPLKKTGIGISGSTPERIRRKSSSSKIDDEVIYTEVEENPQVRLSASDFDVKEPLSTSTPIKDDKNKKNVQVVAMSPKLNDSEDHKEDISSNNVTMSSMKSHIPISKERRSHEKYQRTDDYSQSSESQVAAGPVAEAVAEAAAGAAAEAELEAAAAALTSRFPRGCDSRVLEFARDAEQMARRLHVVLLTVAAVPSERDPAKRLEILKNQLSAVAPDAAALISRGDTLVYDKHKENPQLAEYIHTHYQERLRAKWAMVMAEVDEKRNAAMKAEDDIKELNTLIENLQKWSKEFESRIKTGAEELKEELLDKEDDIERVQELTRDLKVQRVAYPERSAVDVVTSYNKLKDAYETSVPKKDNKKTDGAEAEVVRRLNLARAGAADAKRALRAPPLAGRDFDDFPMQEDALDRVEKSLEAAESVAEEITGGGEQVRRLRAKLSREVSEVRGAAEARRARWAACRARWAALYGALEGEAALLDALERDLRRLPPRPAPALLADLHHRCAERSRCAAAAVSMGGAVVSACGGRLARDVRAQLAHLRDRAQAAADTLRTLPRADPRGGGRGASALAAVRELLLTTSANPSDRTSLAIRLSLVKAREEELSAAAKEAEEAQLMELRDELQQALGQVSAHGAYVRGRLAALARCEARLHAALAWAMDTRARLALAAALPDREPQRLQESVNEKEAEIREVLENYNNIERECIAAKQTVSPEVRERVLKLKEDWDFIRANCKRDDKSVREDSASNREVTDTNRALSGPVREISVESPGQSSPVRETVESSPGRELSESVRVLSGRKSSDECQSSESERKSSDSSASGGASAPPCPLLPAPMPMAVL